MREAVRQGPTGMGIVDFEQIRAPQGVPEKGCSGPGVWLGVVAALLEKGPQCWNMSRGGWSGASRQWVLGR